MPLAASVWRGAKLARGAHSCHATPVGAPVRSYVDMWAMESIALFTVKDATPGGKPMSWHAGPNPRVRIPPPAAPARAARLIREDLGRRDRRRRRPRRGVRAADDAAPPQALTEILRQPGSAITEREHLSRQPPGLATGDDPRPAKPFSFDVTIVASTTRRWLSTRRTD
jgi:hypothetical protein